MTSSENSHRLVTFMRFIKNLMFLYLFHYLLMELHEMKTYYMAHVVQHSYEHYDTPEVGGNE